MLQYTLSDALTLWRTDNTNNQVSSTFEKYLIIALRLYVLPAFVIEQKILSTTEFTQLCDFFAVAQLKEALSVFERQLALAIAAGQVTQKTGCNYRSALKRFMAWLEQQGWWHSLFPDSVVKVAPPRVKLAPKPGTGSKTAVFYGLTKADLPPQVQSELDGFREFRLTGGRNLRRSASMPRMHQTAGLIRRPKMTLVTLSTYKRQEEQILRFYGWYATTYLLDDDCLQFVVLLQEQLKLLAGLTNWRQMLLAAAHLKCLQACYEKCFATLRLNLLTNPDLLYDCTYWAIEHRGVSHSFGVNLLKGAIAVAKWQHYSHSVRRNWSDIPVILDLKDLRNEFAEEYALEKEALEAQKWGFKELTHAEACQVVDYLRLTCAPCHGTRDKQSGTHKYMHKRRLSAVARSWQIYLLVKILVYCPVRQEEIRLWQFGKTLFRRMDGQGHPYYVVYLQEHKRRRTNKVRHYRLPSILTADLDTWLYKWRPLIIQSLQTPEAWMAFWGHRTDKLTATHTQLTAARQGQIPKSVKQSATNYIVYLENQLRGLTQRAAARTIAQQALENNDFFFFKFGKNGKNNTQSFGQPHDVTSVWRVVTYAVARSTKALFGEERWTNPHKLRNIAEKHIRQGGKQGITEAFATLIGHSKQSGDEYAAAITSEYEVTEKIVDNWWHETV